MKLALELDSDRVAAGGDVTGRVRVLEGGASRSLALAIRFIEQTRDFTTIPFDAVLVLHEGDVETGQVFDFSFTLVGDAPPSYKGSHAELRWEVEAASDKPGLDTRVRRPIEVVAAAS